MNFYLRSVLSLNQPYLKILSKSVRILETANTLRYDMAQSAGYKIPAEFSTLLAEGTPRSTIGKFKVGGDDGDGRFCQSWNRGKKSVKNETEPTSRLRSQRQKNFEGLSEIKNNELLGKIR